MVLRSARFNNEIANGNNAIIQRYPLFLPDKTSSPELNLKIKRAVAKKSRAGTRGGQKKKASGPPAGIKQSSGTKNPAYCTKPYAQITSSNGQVRIGGVLEILGAVKRRQPARTRGAAKEPKRSKTLLRRTGEDDELDTFYCKPDYKPPWGAWQPGEKYSLQLEGKTAITTYTKNGIVSTFLE